MRRLSELASCSALGGRTRSTYSVTLPLRSLTRIHGITCRCVTRDERDLISEIHVPVNARDWSRRRIAAADVNQHPRLPQTILFVVGIVIERLEQRTVKLRRPVTVFACLIGRSHVMNGSFNR